MLRLHLKLGQVSSNYMRLLKEPEKIQVLDPKPTLLLPLCSHSQGKATGRQQRWTLETVSKYLMSPGRTGSHRSCG